MEPLHTSNERRGIVLMIVAVIFFAANVLILRAVGLWVPAADAWVATAFRGVVGLMFLALVYRGRGFEPRRLVSRPLVLFRGVAGGAGILLFYETITHLGAGRAVILSLTYPIFGAVIAAVWLKERLVFRQFVWMNVALIGLAVFLSSGVSSTGAGTLKYEVLALIGAVVAGIAVVLIRQLNRTEHPATIYGSQCVWSCLAAVPIFCKAVPSLPWGAVGGLIVASGAVTIGQLALTTAFRELSVMRGSAMQMLLPLATGVGGAFLFGERYSGVELVGAMATLLATWRVVCVPADSRPGRNRNKELDTRG